MAANDHDESRHRREVAARRFHGTAWTHQHWLVKWVDTGDEQALLHYLGRGERYPMIGMAEDIATERAAARLAALREAAEVCEAVEVRMGGESEHAENVLRDVDAARHLAQRSIGADMCKNAILALATRAGGGT
jgi:hypothetical protein